MAEVRRAGTLELQEDTSFQFWQWRAAQALWLVLLGIMLATALGAFGSGPLSRARAAAPGGALAVEYERVARFGASIRLVVHARPQPDGAVRFTVGRALLDGMRVQHVTPAPAATSIVDDGVEYRFEMGEPRIATVLFELQPATRWTVEGEIRSRDGAVQLQQLILP